MVPVIMVGMIMVVMIMVVMIAIFIVNMPRLAMGGVKEIWLKVRNALQVKAAAP